MATALSASDYALWVFSSLLQVGLLLVLLRERTYRRLPFFSLFIFTVTLSDAVVWWAYHEYGYASLTSFSLAWIFQATAMAARGMAVGELCHRVLSPHRGVWALAWRLLAGVAMFLVVYAGLAAFSSRDHLTVFVLTAERGMELAAAVLLMFLLIISWYYRIAIPNPEMLLGISLCAWSLVQVVNNIGLQVWLSSESYFAWTKKIRMVSYQAAVCLWIYAVRRPATATQLQPAMNAESYNRVAPAVNLRLQALNDRLLEIFKQ